MKARVVIGVILLILIILFIASLFLSPMLADFGIILPWAPPITSHSVVPPGSEAAAPEAAAPAASDSLAADIPAPAPTEKTLLDTPVLVSATYVDGKAEIRWNEVDGAVQYRVFKKIDGKWKSQGETASTVWQDADISVDTDYIYTVRCIDAEAASYTSSFDKEGIVFHYTPTSSIVLKKGEEINWKRGIPFTDPGYKAFGRNSENLTKNVETQGEVIPWVLGDYTLTYTVSDEAGVIDTVTRTVHVVPQTIKEPEKPEKTICLTFIDTPCEYTEELLDLLASSKVKATFFVSTYQEDYNDLITKIAENKHAIGIYLPDLSYYNGEDGVINYCLSEIVNMQKIIHEKTGKYSSFIRFQGGTNNVGYLTSQLPGGMDELVDLIHSMGLLVFDWNVDVETSEKTNLIINHFKFPDEPYDYAVTMQQNFRKYSIYAVPKMVSWAKKQGYTFSVLKTTYPEVLFN